MFCYTIGFLLSCCPAICPTPAARVVAPEPARPRALMTAPTARPSQPAPWRRMSAPAPRSTPPTPAVLRTPLPGTPVAMTAFLEPQAADETTPEPPRAAPSPRVTTRRPGSPPQGGPPQPGMPQGGPPQPGMPQGGPPQPGMPQGGLPPGAPDAWRSPGPPGWDPIIARIAHRRPDVAERLMRLAVESPDRLDELLAGSVADILLARLLEAQNNPVLPPPEWRRRGPGPAGDAPPTPDAPPPAEDFRVVAPRRHAQHIAPPRAAPQMRRPAPPGAPYPHDPRASLLERLAAADREDAEFARRTEEAAAAARAEAERSAEDPVRSAAEAQLRDAVLHHFDVRTQRRTLELERIEGELDRLAAAIAEIREDLKRRESDREEIVRTRIGELLRRSNLAR
jgi:hypothetical protein